MENVNRMKKSYLLLLIFALGLVGGTIFVNYVCDLSVVESRLFAVKNMDQVGGLSADRAYFMYILSKRLIFFGLLAGFTLLLGWSLVLYLSTGYYGFCFGVMISMMTVLYDVQGLWVLLGVLMPHFLLYIAAYLILIRLEGARSARTKLPVLLMFFVFFLGCVTECYINPTWLQIFVKKFL